MHDYYSWTFPSEFSYHENIKTRQRDPMSHRIIEKRRRDRMNNCLADLSKLIPTSYLKKGRGRIEKTEIIEMAIKHVKHLEAHVKVSCTDTNKCELRAVSEDERHDEFKQGFREATSETIRFLVELKGLYPHDALCQGLVSHLREHLDKLMSPPHQSNSINDSCVPTSANVRTPPLCSSSSSLGDPLSASSLVGHHSTSGREIRERSASISSFTSDGVSRPGSTPTPPHSNASCSSMLASGIQSSSIRPHCLSMQESMDIEGIESRIGRMGTTVASSHSIVSNSSSSSSGGYHLRDILRHEMATERTETEYESNASSRNTCTSGYGSERGFNGSTYSSSSLSFSDTGATSVGGVVVTKQEPQSTMMINNDVPSLPKSVSPSSESYRFFKKGIKERFQSDMRQASSSNSSSSENSASNSVHNSTHNHTTFASSSPNSSVSISPPSTSPLTNCDVQSNPVTIESVRDTAVHEKVFKFKEKVISTLPAFALHPNGAFYIPLTINPSLISHWLDLSESKDLVSVLHPISIPVNFSYFQKLNHLSPPCSEMSTESVNENRIHRHQVCQTESAASIRVDTPSIRQSTPHQILLAAN
ncbi:uncharacterized protein LOC141856588 isoform X2 [Brevipalpus obovatus]|uniref:uncharacterized protein LOC141856588 isoform X2 n=2 Tax=Brevipalpus obovatus TaxID=246614 RepID=UPI003D9E2526